MTRCNALGCREPATESRDIVMSDGQIVAAKYCTTCAAKYDAALADIEARNAEYDRRVYGR